MAASDSAMTNRPTFILLPVILFLVIAGYFLARSPAVNFSSPAGSPSATIEVVKASVSEPKATLSLINVSQAVSPRREHPSDKKVTPISIKIKSIYSGIRELEDKIANTESKIYRAELDNKSSEIKQLSYHKHYLNKKLKRLLEYQQALQETSEN